jgi:hypothetical protein
MIFINVFAKHIGGKVAFLTQITVKACKNNFGFLRKNDRRK